jgi:hypothetical protein
MEALQAIVERRRGGETGISSVQAFQGPSVWALAGEGVWSRDLFDLALARTPTGIPGRPEDLVRNPLPFVIKYKDGLRGRILICNGLLHSWVFAARSRGGGPPVSTDCRIGFALHTH